MMEATRLHGAVSQQALIFSLILVYREEVKLKLEGICCIDQVGL
jgi:hypothetical protein